MNDGSHRIETLLFYIYIQTSSITLQKVLYKHRNIWKPFVHDIVSVIETQISWVYVFLEAKDVTLKCSSCHIPISRTNNRFDLCP